MGDRQCKRGLVYLLAAVKYCLCETTSFSTFKAVGQSIPYRVTQPVDHTL